MKRTLEIMGSHPLNDKIVIGHLDSSVKHLDLMPAFRAYWQSDVAFTNEAINTLHGTDRVCLPKDAVWKELEAHGLPHDWLDVRYYLFITYIVHPIFDPKNVITDLPMERIARVWEPALGLASRFIENDRALE